MREDVGVVAQRVAAHRDHEVPGFPHDRHPAVGIVRFVEHFGNAARGNIVLQVPHAANVPIAQLAFEFPRRQPRMLEQIALHVRLRPAGLRNRLGDDRADYDERAQRAVAVAGGKGDLPIVEPLHRIGEVRQQLFGRAAGYRGERSAAGVARDRHRVVSRRKSHLDAVRFPADLLQDILVLREHHAPGVAVGRLVGLVRQEAGDVAQVQAPEASDGCVRHEAVAQSALRIVEAKLLDKRAVEHDQRVAARRVAAVLDAVLGVAHGFDRRDEHRHVLGTAAGHHAVDRDVPDSGGALVGEQDAEAFVRVALGKTQERFDFLARWRHDRQPVGEFVLVEIAIHFLETAFHHDIARAGFGLLADGRGRDGQIVDDALQRHFQHVAPQLVLGFGADVAGHHRDRDVPHTEPDRGCGGLLQEAFTG